MKVPALLKLLIYFIFALLGMLLIYSAADSGLGIMNLVRYDKYELYLTPVRALVVIFVMSVFAIVVNWSSSGLLRTLYPTNLFFLILSFMILPGVFFTSNYESYGDIAFYSYSGAVIVFSFGVLLVEYVSRMFTTEQNSPSSYAIRESQSYKFTSITYILFLFFYMFGCISILLTYKSDVNIYEYLGQFIKSGTVSDSVAEIAESRQSIYEDGSNAKNLLNVYSSYSLVMIMPLSALFVLINGLIRNKKIEVAIAILMLVVNFLLLIANGTRLRGMFFLLYIVVAYSFIRPISYKQVKYFSISAIGLLVMQTITLGRMEPGSGYLENIILSLNRVVERIFLTKGYVTQKVFEYIPGITDYRYGETFLGSLGGRLKKDDLIFSEEMNEFITGYAGTAGPQAFGEGYANFGIPGILILSFILGLFVHSTTVIVRKYNKMDAMRVVFLAYVTILVARIGYGDTFTFKNNGMHILIIIGAVFIFAKMFFKSILSNTHHMKYKSNI